MAVSYDRIMPTRRVTISVADGLHARPVADLARIALAHTHPVTMEATSGVVVDLSSVLAVMELGFSRGDEVILTTPDDPSADFLLDALTAVLDPPSNTPAVGLSAE